MRTVYVLSCLFACLAIVASADASIFRRRSGEPRRPFKTIVRGACSSGACHAK